MKHKLVLLLMIVSLVLAACTAAEAPPAGEAVVSAPSPAGEDGAPVCLPPSPGSHQLVDAAHGFCFLYPDPFDVFQGEDGSVTLYVRSLMNTDAPLVSVLVTAANGRSLDDVIKTVLPEFNPESDRPQTVDLGGETAVLLDNLPGQDTNRRIIAMHDGRVVDIMIARVGPEYGAVGEQADAVTRMLTSSFRFVEVVADAPLLAGPECPEAMSGTNLFTNAEDGFCLLLPDGYAVDDSLTTEGGTETAVYMGSLMDTSHARLFITVTDANGRSLDDVTKARGAEIEAILGSSPMWSFGLMVDGMPANQFDQVPGQDFSRQVMLVRDGRLYTLTFIPDDPAAGDAYTDMQVLYDIVMDSFSFLW